MGSAARSIPLAAGAVPGVGGGAGYRGMVISSTAGATVRVWDNTAAAEGTLLDALTVAAGAAASTEYVGGVYVGAGLWVEVVSGDVTGSVRVG